MQGTDRGRFSCKTRNGNWFEESVLEDEKMREFLEKKEKGTLTIQRIRQNLATVEIPQERSGPSDSFLHYGQMVRIANGEMRCFVACDPGDEENREEGLYSCSGSPQMETTARNVWVLKRYEEQNPRDLLTLPADEDDDIVHYGDQFIISTTDAIGSSPFYLASTKTDWAHFSRASRKQLVYSTQNLDFKCVWKIDSVGKDSSFDMEGEPVELGQPLFIKHASTNSPLAVHDAQIFNDYGSEYELVAAREPGKKMIWRFVK
ncbi:hypothetical protein TRFO_06901 [Tritrichomonas foetus]|uniref:Uncharacterized protein n=1 Tax=Tritrichomonas foetus TaxID=1144522 RepID=A0A1J4JUN3_9EUKA|nr:hypothetical protein TRFO_06901 [Tritrichomonas foetus]|eukprot:OHT02863.1 hypothetical protein TRFO_06901 [Tritrichomonas foetus]